MTYTYIPSTLRTEGGQSLLVKVSLVYIESASPARVHSEMLFQVEASFHQGGDKP